MRASGDHSYREFISLLIVTIGFISVGCVRITDSNEPVQLKLLSVNRIASGPAHQAFTDLRFYEGRWCCVFREASSHLSNDGVIRVIRSQNAINWEAAATISVDSSDLRDPKLCVTPSGQLMLSCVSVNPNRQDYSHQTIYWLSDDALVWTGPFPIGEPDVWLWRPVWFRDTLYGVGYSLDESNRFIHLYRGASADSLSVVDWTTTTGSYPNESSLWFNDDGSAVCIVRQDGDDVNSALLGLTSSPYENWTWQSLTLRIGGPDMIRLEDKRYIVASRLYSNGIGRTSLSWLDTKSAALEEFLTLPSGGDTGYPGLVYYQGLLYVSYYSSHEGDADIYLAIIQLPA